MKHLLAETKLELREALKTSKKSDTDCVIEVSGSINSNAVFHRLFTSFLNYVVALFVEAKVSNNHRFPVVS